MADKILGGRYRVQDKIGIGGMATVYRGSDEVLGRTVAIKMMLPQYATDESFAARFKQEAQAAAALQSPYIVGIFDWGKADDSYYIVMEYLRGTDLKSGIKKHGALDARKVAQIASQICSALTVAHQHDIIHRDIKPQNIMVQPDGNIKVMDFGIARAKNSHLTTDNSVLGTAHYVSPEQTQGKDLGPTSDIYSLGVVMYEAATGKVPFDGEDAISVALKQVKEEPVAPSKLNPKIDPTFEAIILKCMAKNPRDRFQTANELRVALTDFLAGRAVSFEGATTMMPAAPTRNMKIAGPGSTAQMAPIKTGENKRGGGKIPADTNANFGSKKPKWSTKKKAIVGGIIGVVALAILIPLIVLLIDSKAVINVVTMNKDEAVQAIQNTNYFEVGDIKESFSDKVEENKVMSQDPAAGMLRGRGTRINLEVSKGKNPGDSVVVPDLKNMTSDAALKALDAVGLKAVIGDPVADDSVEAGKVAQQNPAAGSNATKGDTVTINLSKGKDSVEVPDVTGYTSSSATKTLEDAGFAVAIGASQPSDTVAEGCVITYNPQGSQPKGTKITLTISSGTSVKDVPNVVGKSEADARALLENAGFSVSVTRSPSASVAAGYVISYSPTGRQSTSTVITINVSTGANGMRQNGSLLNSTLGNTGSGRIQAINANDAPGRIRIINANGAPGRIRTVDTHFRRVVLYPLSYRRIIN